MSVFGGGLGWFGGGLGCFNGPFYFFFGLLGQIFGEQKEKGIEQ